MKRIEGGYERRVGVGYSRGSDERRAAAYVPHWTERIGPFLLIFFTTLIAWTAAIGLAGGFK